MPVRADGPPDSAMMWFWNQARSLHASYPFNRYYPGFPIPALRDFTERLLQTSRLIISQFHLNFKIIPVNVGCDESHHFSL